MGYVITGFTCLSVGFLMGFATAALLKANE